MSHIRIFDNPKGAWLRAGQYPPLALSGTFDAYESSLAYEGRIQISNEIGDCSVELLSSTNLPPGYTLTVDQATDEVVLTWPAYSVTASGSVTAAIPNANFESGNTGWDLGPGWTITGSDGTDPGDQTIAGSYSARFKDFAGNSLVLNQIVLPAAEGDTLTATCAVRQGKSKSGNATGTVRLEYVDATGVSIGSAEGNTVSSASDGDVYPSTLTATAPAGTEGVRIGARGFRRAQNHGLRVDTFTLTSTAGATVGTNGTDTISLCLRVTDSAGRTAEGCYTIQSETGAIAAGLLASLSDYWDCDSDMANQGNPGGAGGGGPLSGSGATSFHTGPGGLNNGVEIESLYSVALGIGGVIGTAGRDAFFCVWIKIIGSVATDRIVVGPASTLSGATQRWWVQIVGSGAQLGSGLDDGSDADQPEVYGDTDEDTWYFCACNLNWAAKTATFYLNGVLIGTTSPAVDSVWADMGYMQIRANTANNAIGPPDYFCRIGFMERLATADEITYLYNEGTGKLYADIVADAS